MIDWATIEPGLLALAKSLSGLDVAAWADQQRPMVPGNANGLLLLSHLTSTPYGSFPESENLTAAPVVLAGTVALVNGSANVTFSQAQTIKAEGTSLAFDAQPGVLYALSADVNGTAATLSAPYTGTNAPAAVATFSSDFMFENVIEPAYLTIRVRVECYDQRGGRTARQYLDLMRPRWARLTTDIALTPLGLGFVEVAASQDLSVPRDSHAVSIAAADVQFLIVPVDVDTTAQPPIDSLVTTANLS